MLNKMYSENSSDLIDYEDLDYEFLYSQDLNDLSNEELRSLAESLDREYGRYRYDDENILRINGLIYQIIEGDYRNDDIRKELIRDAVESSFIPGKSRLIKGVEDSGLFANEVEGPFSFLKRNSTPEVRFKRVASVLSNRYRAQGVKEVGRYQYGVDALEIDEERDLISSYILEILEHRGYASAFLETLSHERAHRELSKNSKGLDLKKMRPEKPINYLYHEIFSDVYGRVFAGLDVSDSVVKRMRAYVTPFYKVALEAITGEDEISKIEELRKVIAIGISKGLEPKNMSLALGIGKRDVAYVDDMHFESLKRLVIDDDEDLESEYERFELMQYVRKKTRMARAIQIISAKAAEIVDVQQLVKVNQRAMRKLVIQDYDQEDYQEYLIDEYGDRVEGDSEILSDRYAYKHESGFISFDVKVEIPVGQSELGTVTIDSKFTHNFEPFEDDSTNIEEIPYKDSEVYMEQLRLLLAKYTYYTDKGFEIIVI